MLGTKWKLVVAVVFVAVAAGTAIAGDHCRCSRLCYSNATTCRCPDDYCPKPLPCVPCLKTCWCPNDYCPKPLPCVPCLNTCWCPDNYCPKPLPNLCWPPPPVKYTCGPCR
jgi:hypothetical protein